VQGRRQVASVTGMKVGRQQVRLGIRLTENAREVERQRQKSERKKRVCSGVRRCVVVWCSGWEVEEKEE